MKSDCYSEASGLRKIVLDMKKRQIENATNHNSKATAIPVDWRMVLYCLYPFLPHILHITLQIFSLFRSLCRLLYSLTFIHSKTLGEISSSLRKDLSTKASLEDIVRITQSEISHALKNHILSYESESLNEKIAQKQREVFLKYLFTHFFVYSLSFSLSLR